MKIKNIKLYQRNVDRAELRSALFQEKFLSQAENISGLRLVDGVPESVERGPDTGMLDLQYSENGASKIASFDLIVILSKPKISSEIEALSRKLEREKCIF